MKKFLQLALSLIMVASLLPAMPVIPVMGAPLQETCSMPFEPVSTSLDDLAGEEYLRMDGTATGAYG
jgi:hypothetical protein